MASMASLDLTQTAPLTFWEDGSIRIGTSRIPIDTVVHQFNTGATAEQIQDDFPSLTLREIYGAIAYYLDRQDHMEEYLLRREKEAEQVRQEVEDRTRTEALRQRVRELAAQSKPRK